MDSSSYAPLASTSSTDGVGAAAGSLQGSSLRSQMASLSYADATAALAFPGALEGPASDPEFEEGEDVEPSGEPGMEALEEESASEHPMVRGFAEKLGLSPGNVKVRWKSPAARSDHAAGMAKNRTVHLVEGPDMLEDRDARHTLAHELSHVRQMEGGAPTKAGGKGAAIGDRQSVEADADSMADRIVSGGGADVGVHADAQTTYHKKSPSTGGAQSNKGKPKALLSSGQVKKALAYNRGRGFTRRGIRRICEAVHIPRQSAWTGAVAQGVARFQKNHGLSVDGMAGPSTWGTIKEHLRAEHGLKKGNLLTKAEVQAALAYNAKHEFAPSYVKAVQKKLGITADGVIGPMTCQAIAKFQKSHGIPSFGTLTPKTRKALKKAPKPGAGGVKPGSGHFSLSEFASHDGAPTPSWVKKNLNILIAQLEVLRAALGGRSISITSGYRSPSHNAAVGGAKNSQHLYGQAADFAVSGKSPSQVASAIESLIKQGKMKQGGLGVYSSWVHYDTRGYAARW